MTEAEEKENFDVDWLNERYPFDVEARDKSLEKKVLSYLEKSKDLVLVDVGAGTGSNCLYFINQLPQNQSWYLIEQNTELKKATIRRLKDYANYHKYDFVRKKDSIQISTTTSKITVTIINDSLLNLANLVNLKKVDLVMANAVFDLFSSNQLFQLVTILTQNKVAFYHTLGYESMYFEPTDPFDDVFINSYQEHMERSQDFGEALGKKANLYMIQLFENKDFKVEMAESIWRIEPVDIKMHYYLLNFMENALGEMDLAPAMQQNFERWILRKKDLIITGQQRLRITHKDIFVAG